MYSTFGVFTKMLVMLTFCLIFVGKEASTMDNVANRTDVKGGEWTDVDKETSSSTGSDTENREIFIVTNETTLESFCADYNISSEYCNCTFLSVFCKMIRDHRIFSNAPPITIKIFKCFHNRDKIKGAIAMFSSLFGILGNLLVVAVTKRNWNHSNYCHKLIGGLAFSDLIFAIFQLIDAIPFLWTCKWLYGPVMCKIIPASYHISALMSLGFILIIALERFHGIVYPFTRGLRDQILHFLCYINVAVAIILSIPLFFTLRIGESGRCHEKWPNGKSNSLVYSWVLMIFGFLLPILIIASLYGSIVFKLWKNSENNKTLTFDQLQKRLSENKRIMLLLISLLVFFVLLVMPSRIIWILVDHRVFKNVTLTQYDLIRAFAYVPYSFHVAINPVLYSVMDKKFRNSLKKMFKINGGSWKSIYFYHSSFYNVSKKQKERQNNIPDGRKESYEKKIPDS